MTTDKGVWGLQQVRDKQLQSLWTYSAPGGDAGKLFAWGNNENGQLGQNNTTNYSSPTQLTGFWRGDCGGTAYSALHLRSR